MSSDLLIRHIPDDLKVRLQRRARRNGRSMAAEVRGILATTLAGEPALESTGEPEGIWTRVARSFDGIGVDLDPCIQTIRGQMPRPANFDDAEV